MIKIKGIYEGQGSKWQRVYLPLSEIAKDPEFEVSFIDTNELKEEDLADTQIVFYNWGIQNPPWQLGQLQKKFGIKTVYDIDDSYSVFSKHHPIYGSEKMTNIAKSAVIGHTMQADAVITTNERLKKSLLPYNEDISVIGNHLPVGEGQFVYTKPERDKLHVGILGSIHSHFGDWLVMKQIMNRLAKNPDIVKKCKFYLIGYRKNNKYWNEIASYFRVKKNIDFEIIEGEKPEDYFKLYSYLDVNLVPLEDIEYNKLKSDLRLRECAIANVIPVGSKLYSEKECSGICVAETPLDYEKWIVYLLDKDNYAKTLEYTKRVNLEKNDFGKRVEELKQVFREVVNRKEEELEGVRIVGITYQNNQITEFEEYRNPVKTVEDKSYLFEYNPLIKLVPENESEYLGMFSYKFPMKTGISRRLLYKILEDTNFRKYDIINLSPNYFKEKYFQFSEEQHPGLLSLLKKIVEDLGLKWTEKPKFPTYSNFFIAKNEIYKDYVNNYIIPAIKLMETKYKEEAWKDANYKSGVKNLKELTGLDFWTMHTFVLERLFSVYCENKDYKLLQIN